MKIKIMINPVSTLEIDITQREDVIANLACKYLTGELRADTDETGSGGFWDLANDMINEFENFGIKFLDYKRDIIQDDIYMELKNISKEIIKRKVEKAL